MSTVDTDDKATDPRSQSVDAHVQRVLNDGYTIVEGAIEPELVASLAAELERLERELEVVPATNLFEGTNTIRIYNLLARAKLFEAVPVHASVLPIVERVLGRGCLVSSLSSIAILGGETAQPIHADDQLIPLPKPHVPIVCNTMWALTDFTIENGATRLVPNTHTADKNPELGAAYDSIQAVMKKGSVLVWNGSMWHGGGENRTAERRVGIAMNYCAGWIRQQENQQLGIPREVAKGFSDKLRALVGYGIYRGLLGHVDKCSPVDLLDESGPRRVLGETSWSRKDAMARKW
jgi:ectoine hydroxylase-related dioxygenase (phytanoyl-CoA dioxygenase family)